MKVVVLANLRFIVLSPSWYRLACPVDHLVDLVYTGQEWFLTDGTTHVEVPDRDTGAQMLAKQLNREGRAG